MIARVSTGVLYRVLGVCRLDYSEDAAYVILETLLEEAEMQRGGEESVRIVPLLWLHHPTIIFANSP